jgi:hypothetical protein
MTKIAAMIMCAFAGAALVGAQEAPAGSDGGASAAPAKAPYSRPTEAERFHTYLRHTYGIGSFLEAAARAGIDQGLHRPAEWQLGATGYFERFGSAMGMHIVRGTTTYAFAELFREDLRYVHCARSCSISDKLKFALENTFTARKGTDGHTAFSAARLIGPVSGSLVAATWRPNGFERRGVVREIGLNYGLRFVRNFARELVKR